MSTHVGYLLHHPLGSATLKNNNLFFWSGKNVMFLAHIITTNNYAQITLFLLTSTYILFIPFFCIYAYYL